MNLLKSMARNYATWRLILFFSGPLLALYFIINNDTVENPTIFNTLGIAVWMALWWIAEVAPLAITSLLPVALFPILGIMDGNTVSSAYFNHVIFLFIGGFLMALAIQKWNLHKRIALKILLTIGLSPGKLLFGFMLATALLSMWISNTATTLMMVPILMSILLKMEDINGKEKIGSFATGLLLSIAYASSIGGIATLVGTPPNLSFVRIFDIYFPNGPEIGFGNWILFALPFSIAMFIITFIYLYFIYVRKKINWVKIGKNDLKNELKELGKMTFEEKIVIFLFIILIILWIFRADIEIGDVIIYGWSDIFKNPKLINDGTIAILISILLFIIPSKTKKGSFIMDWKAAEDIPWEIILLFGGGFALANGFKESGLSAWFGEQLSFLNGVHPFVIILAISFIVTFLTELTSNTATVETFLPIMASLAITLNINPLLFMLAATISGSMAFMLPVATPPNAIVFSSKRLLISDMAKAGLFLNIVGAILLTVFVYYYGRIIFDIDFNIFPDWAQNIHK
jgi:solute carrier family 13 (sodium-dependent dicarboxylate transporter), member 2/3/5